MEIDVDSHIVDTASGMCISMDEDVLEAGAVLRLASCRLPSASDPAHSQTFKVNALTGEIQPRAVNLCMTAGWPFLNAVAFKTEKEETVVVVTNEASVSTPIVLADKSLSNRGYLGFVIDARSMETLVY